MTNAVKHVVIVGGGSAGWLTAGILAAEHSVATLPNPLKITLIESSDIPTIGVGEGTWPSMRETLQQIGIPEARFLNTCDASFKQGSKFINWRTQTGDSYYHPFSLPDSFNQLNLAAHWLPYQNEVNFEQAVCFQGALCDGNLAPKQITTPQYHFIANYGYHLDAGKFAPLLKEHCVKKLGVIHIDDTVDDVRLLENGDVHSVNTCKHGEIAGDLFIDCSGLHGLLIDKAMQVPFISCKDVLFNDRALAVQVPYDAKDDTINSATHSTAVENGWIWDIGLQSRRGIGHVYSSDFCTQEAAYETLSHYVSQTSHSNLNDLTVRELHINPGYREKFWHKNVVAVGMSAGFIEPLEASAIALIELSAKFIRDQLPQNRAVMDVIAKRFNKKFQQRWQQIIDFLKLHYVLSERRDSAYWRAATATHTVSETLKDKLLLWQSQPPYLYDSFETEELFPAASYQYIYYGLNGKTHFNPSNTWRTEHAKAQALFQQNQQKRNQLQQQLESNRVLLNKIKQYGLTTI